MTPAVSGSWSSQAAGRAGQAALGAVRWLPQGGRDLEAARRRWRLAHRGRRASGYSIRADGRRRARVRVRRLGRRHPSDRQVQRDDDRRQEARLDRPQGRLRRQTEGTRRHPLTPSRAMMSRRSHRRLRCDHQPVDGVLADDASRLEWAAHRRRPPGPGARPGGVPCQGAACRSPAPRGSRR